MERDSLAEVLFNLERQAAHFLSVLSCGDKRGSTSSSSQPASSSTPANAAQQAYLMSSSFQAHQQTVEEEEKCSKHLAQLIVGVAKYVTTPPATHCIPSSMAAQTP